MHVFASTWLRGGALALMAACGAVPAVGSAEAIAPWRLTSLNGFVALRAYYRNFENQNTSEREPFLQEEFGILTRSYAYHPNFLQMDVSGGLIFDHRKFTRETPTLGSESNTDHQIGWNLGTRFHFLRSKPYPFTLFFDRQNPVVPSGLAGSFTRTNMQYGFDASLLQPLSPVNIDYGVLRTTSEGEGPTQIVDDTNEQVYMTASYSLFTNSTTRLSYNFNRRTSESGARNRTINEISRSDHSTILITRWLLGSRQQYELTSSSNYNIATNPSRIDSSFRPLLTWFHTPNLESFYRYNFSRTTDNEDNDSMTNEGSIGVRYDPFERLTTNAEIGFEIDSEGDDFERHTFGGDGSLSYEHPLPFGQLNFGASAGYSRTNQDAPGFRRNTTDEPLVLRGITPVPLANDFVAPQSVTITNLAETQTYIEGLDYRLIVVGSTTEVERLIAGAIFDGQTVLANYRYVSGGTFKFSVFTQNHSANLAIGRYYNIFARYRDRDQSVISGISTAPLNSINNVEVGANANVPVWRGILIGGRAAYRRQKEDISPFDSTDVDGFVQVPLPLLTRLRLSARRSKTNRSGSGEDLNLTGYNIDLRSRPWLRVTLAANFDYEKNTGGEIERTRRIGDLRAIWRIRRLRVTAKGEYSKETQGTRERERAVAWLLVRRDW